MAASTTKTLSRGWNCLPSEVQDMVLERCTWQTHSEARLLAGTNQLAALTTVCRDWKDFFEGKLFQRLTLKTEADIQTLAQLVQGRRRAHVKWIWLRIELPMYDCQQCHRLETRDDIQIQKATFTNCVWNLFDVLSTWKIKDVRNDGLTLELSAHSPSDAHHFNKDLRFRLHDTAWDRWDDRPVLAHNDPFHGWQYGKQVKTIPRDAKYRLFGSGLRFDYNLPSVRRLHMRLPKVSVVASLVIRRQFPRAIAARKALCPIFNSLTRLSGFLYEPWRGPTSVYQKSHDWHHAFLAREALKARRKTLKKVSIFESHDEVFNRGRSRIDTSQHRDVGSSSRGLARTSHHLEELHVANNIDAYEFFYAFQPRALPEQKIWMAWKNLKNLSLTTQHLAPGHTGLIILMAAEAAKTMPQLQIMELWNYSRSRDIPVACIFRFRRWETGASVELVCTWPAGFKITAETKAAWGRVASAHRPLPLQWKESCWGAGVIDGEYSVLSQLELVGHMLNPVSLRQIAREDQRRREGKAF
ncbi:hypothetical protein Daus18300_011997 [Diaporthe australafricana]|uniref:DUF6546 domain-containing protein n=1 Tax=Diaporthe australafricana TaxID=127596 RepID=A0ABR3W4C3_9PEZI